jgi:predicted RNase H-like nuclease
MRNTYSVKKDVFSGIDACKGGWLCAVITDDKGDYLFETSLSKLINSLPEGNRILVDMPIGLLSKEIEGYSSRPCDAAARKMLGKKHSSVFNPPCMEALYETDYWKASATNNAVLGKKLSKQSWYLFPKIKEINAFLHLNPLWKSRVLEAHPELAFQFLNQNRPLQHSKKTKEGIDERLEILTQYYPATRNVFSEAFNESSLLKNALPDDMADALCLAILNKTRKKELKNISNDQLFDILGNQMAIWI